jgi:type I restriction enzyme S subunit
MFLRWSKIQDKITDLAGTTTIPDLNHGDFYDLPVFFPDINEQKKIVDIANALSAEIKNEKFELEKLCSIKKALMQDLLTGKKRVTPLLNETEVIN